MTNQIALMFAITPLIASPYISEPCPDTTERSTGPYVRRPRAPVGRQPGGGGTRAPRTSEPLAQEQREEPSQPPRDPITDTQGKRKRRRCRYIPNEETSAHNCMRSSDKLPNLFDKITNQGVFNLSARKLSVGEKAVLAHVANNKLRLGIKT